MQNSFFWKQSIFFAILVLIGCTKNPNENTSMTAMTDNTEAKIDSLIGLMTLEEKIGMIHANSSFTSGGVPRLGIPELVMSDGPCGVRKEHGRDWELDKGVDDSATYLPTGVALAATWNPDLGYQFGKVLGSEAKYRGKDVILAPGINIMRTPLNGRNYEYLSEDPHLISKMVVGYINGVQDQDISACVKHYLANNQEIDRNIINVEMSERALREIYLPGFKAAVQEGKVNTLMGAYNQFRGEYCTHNNYLINEILKGEFNFKGVVISDWNAVHNSMQSLMNGCDIEMGTELSMQTHDYSKFYMGDSALALVKSKKVPESIIDDKVRRILRVMFKSKMFETRTPGTFNTRENQTIAAKIAEEAIVLLKNEELLPLDKNNHKTIAVIGANAIHKHAGAGGSAQVNAKYEITPLEGIQKITEGKATVTFTQGYLIKKDQKASSELIREAVEAAKNADAVILVGGTFHGYTDEWKDNAYDAESLDKPDMKLPFGQDELINAVLKANPKTVILLMGGGPVDMTAWVDKAKGIIQGWYPGMEGGNAIAKVLFGEINPSGKLPVTFPKKLEDVPAHKLGDYPGNGKTVRYKEGIYVGYRYYDTYKVEPLFPFGHGLSYTTFNVKKLTVSRAENTISVKAEVKNTGTIAGSEVLQIYVKDETASIDRPDKELKAFKKVYLNPGESKTIEMTLPSEAFQFYDEKKKQWILEPGKFTIMAGTSSRDIKQTAEIEL